MFQKLFWIVFVNINDDYLIIIRQANLPGSAISDRYSDKIPYRLHVMLLCLLVLPHPLLGSVFSSDK